MANEINPEKPRSFSVSKYLEAFKRRVLKEIPPIWVHGVITQIQVREKIVYLSIAEYLKDDVKPVATLPLFIFTNHFKSLSEKLLTIPKPFRLEQGIKVNFLIEADFYIPAGKFQAKILDIDPAYTIGELILTKEAILQRLRTENLLHKNASLPFAKLPLSVGLITGEGTAAYQDFTTKLSESRFPFRIYPAYAKMQGNETENTILAALGKLREYPDLDVVCIVRGGGSKTDLNYFDSEILCRAVANFPIPVLTGIGHEIDLSLLDQVAWQHYITPTDCAKFLTECIADAMLEMRDLVYDIAGRVRVALIREQERQNDIRNALQIGTGRLIAREREYLNTFVRSFRHDSEHFLNQATFETTLCLENLKKSFSNFTHLTEAKLDVLEERLHALDPKTILARGYSLTFNDSGKLIKNAADVVCGMKLVTRFADGDVQSVAETSSF